MIDATSVPPRRNRRSDYRSFLTIPTRWMDNDAYGHVNNVYEIGLFRQGEDSAAAQGRFVHVWVERSTQRPVRVPEKIRGALAPLLDRSA